VYIMLLEYVFAMRLLNNYTHSCITIQLYM